MFKKIGLIFCLICSMVAPFSVPIQGTQNDEIVATATRLGVDVGDMYLATDTGTFGSNALQKNMAEDQSAKLAAIIIKTKNDNKWLYIPQGTYIVNKTVFLSEKVKITGSMTGATILKNETENPIFLETNRMMYPNLKTIYIKNLFLDGIGVYSQLTTDLQVEDNIFYNPRAKFIIEVRVTTGSSISNNMFLRDFEHQGVPKDWGRTILINGFATKERYEWSKDVKINNNIFGAKINELDAIKTFSQPQTVQTIQRLQNALEAGELTLKNEQNVVVTGINSFNNLRETYIENNLFYSFHDDLGLEKLNQDHAIYLRGSQDIYIANNHIRGWHNGPAGGIKFKSGKNITIVNNYIRNTGLIMYSTAEYGFGESAAGGTVSILSSFLVANNIFDWKKWDDSYSVGIEYQRVEVPDALVENMVFIGNEYVNFKNIPQGVRKGIYQHEPYEDGKNGFKPQTTFLASTRDDTDDRVLGVQYWKSKDYALMPKTWDGLITQKHKDYYLKKIKEPMPVQDELPVAVKTKVELGAGVDPKTLVSSVFNKDEVAPIITVENPEVFNKLETKEAKVLIKYTSRNTNTAVIRVPVEVVDTVAPVINVVKTVFELGKEIGVNDIVSVSDLDPKTSLRLTQKANELVLGSQEITVEATDSSGNMTQQKVMLTLVDTIAPIINIKITKFEQGAKIAVADIATAVDLDTKTTLEMSPQIDSSILGEQEVVLVAIDSTGNKTEQKVVVEIVDTVVPLITINKTIFEQGSKISAADIAAVTDDDAKTTLEMSPQIDSSILGKQEVILVATDSTGNKTEQKVVVEIVDTSSPVINIKQTNFEQGSKISAADIAVVTDADAKTTLEMSPQIDSSILGKQEVILVATDSTGNKSSLDVTIIITSKGTPLPQISVLKTSFELGTKIEADQIVSISEFPQGTQLAISPQANGLVLGNQEINVIVTELSGKKTERKVTITVSDTVAPTITSKQTSFAQGAKITATDIATVFDFDNLTKLTIAPEINAELVGVQNITATAIDSTGNKAAIIIPITITKPTAPIITILKTNFERGRKIAITDIVSVENNDAGIMALRASTAEIKITISPEIDVLKLGKQELEVVVTDTRGNKIVEQITIEIYKAKLQLDIEALFDGQQLRANLTTAEIEALLKELDGVENESLKEEYRALLNTAIAMLEKQDSRSKQPIVSGKQGAKILPRTGNSPQTLIFLSLITGSICLVIAKKQKQ
ncbi:MAG: glycosyl hydrolase family 28-related protein [Culicoidibacterales bacterium]